MPDDTDDRDVRVEIPSTPGFLFVPVSGPAGGGEYFRALAVAGAVRARWPRAAIRFIVNREAGYSADVPFDTVLVDGTPTHATPQVSRAIDDTGADVVVFDSAGRVAQFAHARRRGAATVYVSSRPTARWRGFRLRRMRLLDQHWLAWPRFLAGGLTAWERAKLALVGRPEVVFLDPLVPPVDRSDGAARRRLGLEGRRYVLVAAGAGGHRPGGVPAPDTLASAAVRAGRATGHPVVWIRGPNYAGSWDGDGEVIQLDSVTPGEMVDWLSHAHLAIVNGGSLLLQAVAVKAVAIAVPVVPDQSARIEACRRQDLVAGAPLDPEALAEAAIRLLGDDARMAGIRARLDSLQLSNGLDQAVHAVSRLVTRRRRP